ncbi:NAD-dependent epimerase/dehydratase family protein [Candidatus Micrarchaeota archaeon]|nr:NAD-dependent epimerase/dehydratase family protein [Candidatus Micrarchaeota archaeon]
MKLVTGGAGFIGSHLCEALAKKDDVRVLDNFSVGTQNKAWLEEKGVDVVEGDIRDLEIVKEAIADCDAVFHLAAMNRAARSIENPLEANAVNVDGTLNVLEACRKADVEKLVFASSSSVYGGGTELNREDQACRPLHPYAVGKLAGEEYSRVYYSLYNLKTVVLRYVSVYGPRQRGDISYAAVVPKFIEQITAGKKVTVYGSGDQTRQFTYVADTVALTLAAAKSPKAVGHVFNVASEQPRRVNEIVSCLEKITGKKAKVTHEQKKPGDPDANPIDTKKSREFLGVSATTALEQGLSEMVEWYEKTRE